MGRTFDRTDTESRALKACYRDLGERLAQEVGFLRADLHAKFYPGFGRISPLKARFIPQRLRQWTELFRTRSEALFRLSAEVEAKLVHSIALDQHNDYRQVFEVLRTRKQQADLILRALGWRVRKFLGAEQVDTEALFDFCEQAQRAALFLQFTAVVLLARSGRDNMPAADTSFLGIDWAEFERLGRNLPTAIRAEYAEFAPAGPEPIDVTPIDIPVAATAEDGSAGRSRTGGRMRQAAFRRGETEGAETPRARPRASAQPRR